MEKIREPYKRFKEFLLINNINQKELAEKLGRSPSFFNRAINGTGKQFTADDIFRMKCLLGINVIEYL